MKATYDVSGSLVNKGSCYGAVTALPTSWKTMVAVLKLKRTNIKTSRKGRAIKVNTDTSLPSASRINPRRALQMHTVPGDTKYPA